jgi:hypothetical protein
VVIWVSRKGKLSHSVLIIRLMLQGVQINDLSFFFFFLCVSFLSALFIVLRYLCLYDVPYLKLAIWLLTRHVNKRELN